jgi:hypothetical protein
MEPKLVTAHSPNMLPLYFNFETFKFDNEAEMENSLCKEDYLTNDENDLMNVKETAFKQGYSNVFISTICFADVEKVANK